MGRELRKVPNGWEHPKKDDGSYQPMFDKYYGDALNEWFDEHNQSENGTHPDLKDDPGGNYWHFNYYSFKPCQRNSNPKSKLVPKVSQDV